MKLETEEATSSHSYEHPSSPAPRVAQSATGLSLDRPPVRVVAIRNTAPKVVSKSFLEPRSASGAYGRDEEEASVSTTCMKNLPSAFRLRPRGKPMCTPSPASSASSRGRKRSAQCLATQVVAIGAMSKNLFPSSSLPSESSAGLFASRKSPPSGSFSPIESPQTPGVETSLRNLSIQQSPKIARRPVESSRPLRTETAGSSFKAYHASSPAGSRCYIQSADSTCTGSTPASKLGIDSPSSSTRSSPRFAPCTVILRRETGVASENFIQQHPPLHSGPASLLFSLDGTDGDASDNDLVATPKRYPSAVEYHPRLSNEPSPGNLVCCSSIDAASPSYYGRSYPSPRTPLRTHESQSNGRDYRSSHASLPKFSFTPKSTPKGTDLPRVGNGLILLRPSPQASVLSFKQMTPDTSVLSAPPDFLGTQQKWKYRSSNSLTLTVEGDDAAGSFEPGMPKEGTSYAKFLPQHRDPSFHIPEYDWGDRARSVPSCISQRGLLRPSFAARRTSSTPPLAPDHETTALLGVTAQSFRTPSRSGSLLQAMMEQADDRESALNFDEGDLTDDDDDEGFILTAPGVLAEEHEAQNRDSIRARQRPRLGYAKPNQTRPSMTSLYSSAQTSNTSLLGMDVMQHESSSPACSPRREVPGFNPASKAGSSARLPGSDFLSSPGCSFPMLGLSQSSFAARNIELALDSGG